MKKYIAMRIASGAMSLAMLSGMLPFAAAGADSAGITEQSVAQPAADDSASAADKLSFHITTNYPEAKDPGGIDGWTITAVKSEDYDFTRHSIDDPNDIIQMLMNAPDGTFQNTGTINLEAGDVIRIVAPSHAEYSAVEIVMNGTKVQIANTPQPGKLCCPDPENHPLINVYIVPEGLSGMQEMQVNFVAEQTLQTPGGTDDNSDNSDDEWIDDYGRSFKRVVGGTYYAEQIGSNNYIQRISSYECPNNNGGKHQLEYHKQAPTCERSDFNYYRCTLCGETELIADHPALGHDYQGKITRPATATQDGIKTFTCTRCGGSYTETIPKFGSSSEELGSTEESPVQKDPNAQSAVTDNKGDNSYASYCAKTMKSYLYSRRDGGYTRVESLGDKIAVEVYDKDFQLLTSDTVPMELSIFGGFYAGDGYNFLIFGQENPEESNQKEVIRVVKYSKDWKRLDQASLKGANTTIPFCAGSLRCAEYNGYLYVQTCHEMYTSAKDGLNHQANLIFCVRENDMSITDSQYNVSSQSTGYVSHSFNQFTLVDEEGYLVTLNHGDFYPRGAYLHRFQEPAGQDDFINYRYDGAVIHSFSESKNTYQYTGAMLGGLSDSSSNYLSVYSIVPSYGYIEDHDVKNVVIALSDTTRYQITNYTEDGPQSASTPALVKLSSNRFLVLWNIAERENGFYFIRNKMGYAFVDGSGKLIGSIHTAEGSLSDCQPIYNGTDVVWYYTDDSAPVFCSINAASGAFESAGMVQQPNKEDPVQPYEEMPSEPDEELPLEPEPDEEIVPDLDKQVNYSDVPSNFWGQDYITKVTQANLMEGIAENEFDPDGNLTMAQVLTLAYRLHHRHSGKDLPDVTDRYAWYMPYFQYCVENGIIHAEEVSPMGLDDQSITRYEMVEILNKAVSDEQMEPILDLANGDIPDVDENSEYGLEVYRWYRAGVLIGNEGGLFCGENSLTRAEVAAILCRLYGLLE